MPEQQQQKEIFQKLQIDAIKIIHAPETRDSILQAIVDKGGTPKAVADVAGSVMERLEAEMPQISPMMKLAGGSFVLADLFTTAEKAGVLKQSPTQNDQQRAMGQLVQQFTEQAISNGEATPEELQQAAAKVGGAPQQQIPANNQPQVAQGGLLNG